MRDQVIEKVSALITGAFGLVAALAWNSAIQDLFAKYHPEPGQGIAGKVIYAASVTLVAVIVIVWVTKAADKAKAREDAINKQKQKTDNKIKKVNKTKR